MFDEQIPILLKDSRYAVRLPIGQKAVLDTFQHEDLRRFYRTWYRPDLMGFVAVGDIEPAEVEALVQEYFARIPAAENPPERTVFPVPDHEETLFAITTDPEATLQQRQHLLQDGCAAPRDGEHLPPLAD